jgi:hypothetical protein
LPTPSPVATPDAATTGENLICPTFRDDEINALRGHTCDGSCSDGFASPYALATPTEIVAATAGMWLFCGSKPFGPDDAIGIEFAPGCRIFFLRRDSVGTPVRGTEASYQANFDVYDVTGSDAPRRIVLEFSETSKIVLAVRAAACPNRLELTDEMHGETTELMPAGVGIPVK